jgi:hypothetical protein
MTQIIGLFVVGASSTGKTTLCRALDKCLTDANTKVHHISEVARNVMKDQGYSRADVGTLEMQQAILQEQIKRESAFLSSFKSSDVAKDGTHAGAAETVVLICDRCAIDPVIYATMNLSPEIVENLTRTSEFSTAVARYAGRTSGTGLGGVDRAQDVHVQSFVILTDGVEAWRIDDGVRSLYNPWEATEVFRKKLTELGISYNEIGENILDINERVDWVMKLTGLEHLLQH